MGRYRKRFLKRHLKGRIRQRCYRLEFIETSSRCRSACVQIFADGKRKCDGTVLTTSRHIPDALRAAQGRLAQVRVMSFTFWRDIPSVMPMITCTHLPSLVLLLTDKVLYSPPCPRLMNPWVASRDFRLAWRPFRYGFQGKV